MIDKRKGLTVHGKSEHAASPTQTVNDGGAAVRSKRTPAEQRAEIERVAREHGADLSEEGFNEALRKVGKIS